MMRVCGQRGCPAITATSYCEQHTRERERARGTRTQRGYDSSHVAMRQAFKQEVEAGTMNCARCGQPITPGTAWHLDHTDDRLSYLGPSHASCNTSAGGKASHA